MFNLPMFIADFRTGVVSVMLCLMLSGCAFLELGNQSETRPLPDLGAESGIERSSYQSAKVIDGAISYVRSGDFDGQRIIFVHGTPGSSWGWQNFIRYPKPGLEYLAIDRPGFGHSRELEVLPDIEDQAALLEPLLVERGGRKPILVGFSLGGPIVVRAALDYPDRVGGLVIAAGALDPELEKIHPAQRLAKVWPLSAMLKSWAKNSNDELLALKAGLERMQPQLRELNVPVAIVHGTADHLVPFENVDFMKRHFVSTEPEYFIKPGGSHFMDYQAVPEINAAIDVIAEKTRVESASSAH